jgi:hypothetical protein
MYKYFVFLLVILFSSNAIAANKIIPDYATKTTPTASDWLLISDQAAAGAYKKTPANYIQKVSPAITAGHALIADGSGGVGDGGEIIPLTAGQGISIGSGVISQTPTAEVDGHASGNLTAANVTNTIIYNTGQAAEDIASTLPTAAFGYSFLYTVSTAQSNKAGVRANTGDKVYLLAADGTVSAGSDNGYARMTAAQVGQCFACWTFKTDAYDWMCKAIAIGTSTFAAN